MKYRWAKKKINAHTGTAESENENRKNMKNEKLRHVPSKQRKKKKTGIIVVYT